MATAYSDAWEMQSNELSVLIGAKFVHAFVECSEAVQVVVMDMLSIIQDEEADEDERHMALVTLGEALFPNYHEGKLGMDLAESESETAARNKELASIVDEMNEEEATFADNLARVMDEKGVNQKELAEKIGVGQPAISNMLTRSCRPQKRTIARLAEALDVDPKSLWPK